MAGDHPTTTSLRDRSLGCLPTFGLPASLVVHHSDFYGLVSKVALTPYRCGAYYAKARRLPVSRGSLCLVHPPPSVVVNNKGIIHCLNADAMAKCDFIYGVRKVLLCLAF